MASKFDSELLKKHHFWFLFIPVCVALFLAWYGLFIEVPDAVSGTAEKLEQKKKGITNVKAQPRAMIKEYEKQVGQLDVQRVKMWQQAWEQQKAVFAWPTEGLTGPQLDAVKDLKFGEPVPESARIDERFEGAYQAEYKKLIEKLEPMDFRDRWDRVLRYVPTFPRRPNSEDMWLALEDLWVQREVLEAIHKVNAEAAVFKTAAEWSDKANTGPVPNGPKHRVFQSRLWELDLSLTEKDNVRRLEGTLKNISPRLQVMGVGNVMRLKVWLTPQAKTPYIFEVQGGAVEAGQTIKIKTLDSHTIPADWKATELFKVEQQFDVRTVPIKRVEHLALGKLSDRNHQSLQLQMAKFSKAIADRETPTGAAGGGNMGFMGGGIGTPPAPGGMLGATGATPMPGGMGGAMGFGGGATGYGMTGEGSQPAALNALTQNKLQRYRYIDITDQVRRMPLGVAVVTDQSYMKDILESLANIRLRFQITQMHWTRFHTQLNYGTSGTLNSGSGFPMPGRFGMPPSDDDPMTPMSGVPNNYNPLGAAAPTNSREDQFSANLMELSVYGLISLYEKYDEAAAAGKTPADPAIPPVNNPTPPVNPTPPAPMPMAPAPPGVPEKK